MTYDVVVARYRCVADVVWRRQLGGGVYLLPVGSADPVEVSAPGALIWQLLAEPLTIDELASAVAERFGVPQAEVRTDMALVVEQLVSVGAVLVQR